MAQAPTVPETPSTAIPRHWALGALIALVAAPTIGTYAAMHLDLGALGLVIYGLSKAWILAVPLAWRLLIERKPISFSPVLNGGLKTGVILGIVTMVVILAGYFLLGPAMIGPEALDAFRTKLTEKGFANPWFFGGALVYICLFNSVLEEYVWRWFVFSRCEDVVPRGRGAGALAVLLSALLFTIHHAVALSASVGWGVNLLACAGVFIGGTMWSAMYLKYRSVWPGWVAHVFADIGVYAVTGFMLFGSGAAAA